LSYDYGGTDAVGLAWVARKEQSLVKTTTFKMSATTQTQLKEVSKSLGITPSEFIRDAVVEGLNVLHLDKQSNE
jgi:hypothetical protein